MENITSFFFNIIPGALLILILETKSNVKVINELFGIDPLNEHYLLWLIIFSVFIGFFLQAATKYAKEKFLYQIIFCQVKKDDHKNFEKAEVYLTERGLLAGTEDKKGIEKMFFTMDNYISLAGGGRLLPHFASRLAYWSNLFWVSLIIIIFVLRQNINDTAIIFWTAVVFVVSIYESWVHLKNHYDIVLRSFISLVNIDNKE